jgi:prepilin-type N-terminal cleavage/methylation domain-containing protein
LSKPKSQQGFTIIELTVALVVTAIIITTIYTFFNTSINQYLNLQRDGMSASDLALQAQRLASVMRGATDIVMASNHEMVINTYFSPNDVYVSQVRYYKSEDGTKLLADVTPFSANPPGGTLETSRMVTSSIIDNFYTNETVNTFEYIDSSGQTMSLPVNDLHTIKGLRVNLVSKPPGVNNSLSVQVSLRNRKTNL